MIGLLMKCSQKYSKLPQVLIALLQVVQNILETHALILIHLSKLIGNQLT